MKFKLIPDFDFNDVYTKKCLPNCIQIKSKQLRLPPENHSAKDSWQKTLLFLDKNFSEILKVYLRIVQHYLRLHG